MSKILILEIYGSRSSTYGQNIRRMFSRSGGTIGRSSNCDVVLPAPAVSRLHADIYTAGNNFYVHDRSRNGTSLNGQPMARGEAAELAEGDHLQIDGYDILVRLADDVDEYAASSNAGVPPDAEAPARSLSGDKSDIPAGSGFRSLRGQDRRRNKQQDNVSSIGTTTGARAEYLARWASGVDGTDGANGDQTPATADGEQLSRSFARVHDMLDRMGTDEIHLLISTMVGGIMATLATRQEAKNSFRLPVTIVKRQDNNPLKFAPDAEEALERILDKSSKSFLSGEDAFDDAFIDMREHQLATLAAMRSAFDALLNQFDPQQIDRDAQKRPGKSGARRGGDKNAAERNWSRYEAIFDGLPSNAEDRFQRLFGEEFAKAYEEELAAQKARRS